MAPAIIWKDEHFYELLLKLCNYCAFEHKRCPSYWRKSQIIPVPKKGDLSLVTNYRGISLLPISAKIYNKLILIVFYHLLIHFFEKSKWSTLSQILALRRIIEEISHCNRNSALVFIDFNRAFARWTGK